MCSCSAEAAPSTEPLRPVSATNKAAKAVAQSMGAKLSLRTVFFRSCPGSCGAPLGFLVGVRMCMAQYTKLFAQLGPDVIFLFEPSIVWGS